MWSFGVVDPEKIKQLVEMMAEYELSELVLRDGEEEIRLSRAGSPACAPPQMHFGPSPASPPMTSMPHMQPPPQAMGQEASGSSAGASSPAGADSGLEAITSPMVGTFYSSPDPSSPTFVSEGAMVNESTVVCIIEAMKVFNEINAGIRGTIEKVLLKNEEPVEYGQPLFLVRPS